MKFEINAFVLSQTAYSYIVEAKTLEEAIKKSQDKINKEIPADDWIDDINGAETSQDAEVDF